MKQAYQGESTPEGSASADAGAERRCELEAQSIVSRQRNCTTVACPSYRSGPPSTNKVSHTSYDQQSKETQKHTGAANRASVGRMPKTRVGCILTAAQRGAKEARRGIEQGVRPNVLGRWKLWKVESQWHEVIRWHESESGIGKKKSLSHEWLENARGLIIPYVTNKMRISLNHSRRLLARSFHPAASVNLLLIDPL